MQTLIVKTESEAAAKLLLAFLKTVRLVKSITFAPSEDKATSTRGVNEPASEYNWINPSRPATDEEIDRMLDECENSPSFSSKEAREITRREIKEWRAKK